MNQQKINQPLKGKIAWLMWTGHLAMITLLVFSVVFFVERCTFLDPSFQLFEMINREGFKYYVHRYSMVINQVLPVIAIKSGLSLKWIMLSYSVSFVVIYYFCFILGLHVLKDLAAPIALAAVPLVVRDAFVHSISENWLGIAYSGVFFSWIRFNLLRDRFVPPHWFFINSILIILVNYHLHPVTLFTLSFSLVFLALFYQRFNSWQLWTVLALIVLIYGYKFLFPATDHEQGFFSNVKNIHAWPMAFKGGLFRFFTSHFFKLYIWIFLFWAVSMFLLWKNGKVLATLFLAAWMPGFFFLILITFGNGESMAGMESRFMPFIFFTMIPFALCLNDASLFVKKISIVVLALLLVYSFSMLASKVHTKYTARLQYIESIFQRHEHIPTRKFFIKYANLNKEKWVLTWATAVESLLLTSVKGREFSKTLFVEDLVPMPEWMLQGNDRFLQVDWWQYIKEDKLNSRYFDLKNTAYYVIKEFQP
ncbi:MAG: hypothetical protein N2167_06115 [Flavobacteriales bacterium]|nr:hypothetical protein [Flavobacteriales bacterium]